MKRHLILGALFFGFNLYAQVDCKSVLVENTTLKTENNYLKKVLDLNKSIVEIEKDNLLFSIIEIKGNTADKSIQITFLAGTKAEYLSLYLKDLSIIDLEGNEYKLDFSKSSIVNQELSQNAPLKLTFVFKEVQNNTLFLKILKFKVTSKAKKYATEGFNSHFEFRDLKVVWN